MAEPSPTNPPPLQCLSCWYTIGTHDAAACPECGEPVTEVTRRFFYRRAALTLEARPGETRSTLTILGGIALYVAFIAISTFYFPLILAGFFATLALALVGWAAAFAITPWLGSKARATDPRPERTLSRLLWNRHVVLLHVPWLLPPLLAIVFAVVGALLRIVFSGSSPVEPFVVLLLFIFWVFGWIAAITEWIDRWGQDLDAAYLRGTSVPRVAAGVACVLFLVNLIAGFFGGIAMIAAAWHLLR